MYMLFATQLNRIEHTIIQASFWKIYKLLLQRKTVVFHAVVHP